MYPLCELLLHERKCNTARIFLPHFFPVHVAQNNTPGFVCSVPHLKQRINRKRSTNHDSFHSPPLPCQHEHVVITRYGSNFCFTAGQKKHDLQKCTLFCFMATANRLQMIYCAFFI